MNLRRIILPSPWTSPICAVDTDHRYVVGIFQTADHDVIEKAAGRVARYVKQRFAADYRIQHDRAISCQEEDSGAHDIFLGGPGPEVPMGANHRKEIVRAHSDYVVFAMSYAFAEAEAALLVVSTII